MVGNIHALIRHDTVMFEYDVLDMERAMAWYRDILGLKVIYGPYACHTEFALPVQGARLALSLASPDTQIRKGPRLFISTTDVRAVEAYLREKGANTKPIDTVDGAVLILWVLDSEGNHLAIEQWLDR